MCWHVSGHFSVLISRSAYVLRVTFGVLILSVLLFLDLIIISICKYGVVLVAKKTSA